mgnify:CR=1 FL=1
MIDPTAPASDSGGGLSPRPLHRVDTVAMDTWVSVQVVSDRPGEVVESAARRALQWLTTVERALFTVDQARKGHRRVGLFDAGAYGDPAATLALMSEMAQAITAGDLVLHLQPRHDMRRGRTSGVEALVRWRHPRLGLLSPDKFVGVAEATGHIRPMTEWVLRNALEQQAALKAARHDLEMSINVPGRLLSDPDFIESAITHAAKAEGRNRVFLDQQQGDFEIHRRRAA